MDRQPGPRRGENVPPPGSNSHRPTRSQEEALRARRLQGGPSKPAPESPPRRQQRRPRRNSESSLIDFDAQPLTEEEKKMIEATRRARLRQEQKRAGGARERETREPQLIDISTGDKEVEKEKHEVKDKKSARPTRPSRRMDIIDQLDATSIYGTGRKYEAFVTMVFY